MPGGATGAGPELDYSARKGILTKNKIAVWDVLASSVRPGSMDSSIDPATAEINDFESLFREQPALELVCFNGQAAAKLFRKLVAPSLENGPNNLKYETLPSTSPAFASMSFEQKLDRWRSALIDAARQKGE